MKVRPPYSHSYPATWSRLYTSYWATEVADAMLEHNKKGPREEGEEVGVACEQRLAYFRELEAIVTLRKGVLLRFRVETVFLVEFEVVRAGGLPCLSV